MKKIISALLTFTIIGSMFSFTTIQSFAHSAMLNVEYDACENNEDGDGLNESWYFTRKGTYCYHLDHEETTIKYYFEETSLDGTCGWTDAVSPNISIEEVNQIKEAYANSMKKWNNIYYYSYDSNENVVKHKVINVIEGTEEDHNLSIYPASGGLYIASTARADAGVNQDSEDYLHTHHSEWRMNLYVYYFSSCNSYGESYIDSVRERTGAHELGHVLGIFDVDNECTQSEESDHHTEILMGYGSPITSRSQDITYKDIAGVAITRGFHTDEDHKWLNCGIQSDGKYKLLCSICNGIIKVDSLSGYAYNTYNSCSGNHTLSSGNMMAVASYGTKDYYKCKYCRYVAPFSSNITQNYVKTYYSGDLYTRVYKYVNDVEGLNYKFYEEHNISYSYYTPTQHYRHCSKCGLGHEDHDYNIVTSTSETGHIFNCVCGVSSSYEAHYDHNYVRNNRATHYVKCECGYTIRKDYHIVPVGGTGLKFCIYCGELIDSSSEITPVPGGPTSTSDIFYITDAGSYVDSYGVIYLVESDMKLFLAGELDVYTLAENVNGYPSV